MEEQEKVGKYDSCGLYGKEKKYFKNKIKSNIKYKIKSNTR